MYDNLLVSSFEKSSGHDFLGEELTCLALWLFMDKQRQGFMTVQNSKDFFEGLRFVIDPYTLDEFKEEF